FTARSVASPQPASMPAIALKRGVQAASSRTRRAGSAWYPPRRMAWYKRERDDDAAAIEKRSIPAGVFTKCPGCRAALLTAEIEQSQYVCRRCSHHFLMPTARRIELVTDA